MSAVKVWISSWYESANKSEPKLTRKERRNVTAYKTAVAQLHKAANLPVGDVGDDIFKRWNHRLIQAKNVLRRTMSEEQILRIGRN